MVVGGLSGLGHLPHPFDTGEERRELDGTPKRTVGAGPTVEFGGSGVCLFIG
ncbi:hypothetical protein MBRU_03425 [Mycolicibacterium brumae DSM 44177]|nr:hypothetical protein MBRU_03425 [Mycolicibacterium brumae DSM 44177]